MKKLPRIDFEREVSFEAVIHSLDADAKVSSGQHHYFGFTFNTPDWIDGPVTWLAASDQERAGGQRWIILSDSGETVATLTAELQNLDAYPRIAKAFPIAHSIEALAVPLEKIAPNRRYHVLRPVEPDQASPLGIVLTIDSIRGRFQFGDLARDFPIPAKPLTPEEAMIATLQLRENKGDDEALAFLAGELRERVVATSEFRNMFVYIWQEAQIRSGRTDPAWASLLNDVAFTVSYEERCYGDAFEIVSNLCSTLGGSGRFGRLAEVMALWEEAQRMGGNRMDIRAAPDLGPAIPCLPEIRHRDIPASLPYAERSPEGRPPRNRPNRFHVNDAGAFHDYGWLNYAAGRWSEGLEWLVWTRDWATNKQTGQPVGESATTWFAVTESIISLLKDMGFHDEALAITDDALAAPHGQTYRGRSGITLGIERLDILRQLDRAPDDMVDQLRRLVERAQGNLLIGKGQHWIAKMSLAQALLHTGRFGEAEAMLDALVAEGFQFARWTRVNHWIASGRVEGVEQEFQALLRQHRENGHKLYECSLYSDYAGFLETQGRDREAILMRREVVRLARTFDLFHRLPVDLARMAELLHRLGDEFGSAATADEAHRLLKGGRIPQGRADEAKKILGRLGLAPAAPDPNSAPNIDFQPQRSVVVPLEAAPWVTYLTLSNPGDQARAGILNIQGLPLDVRVEEDTDNIVATLLKPAESGKDSLSLTIGPGTYRLIRIHGTEATHAKGELLLAWRADESDTPVEAEVSIEAPESGVTGAIIQAGNYRTNPFYGVPVHHHYVTKSDTPTSPPLRFVCSQPTRVEVYLLDDTPLAIDGQGNGSLLDQGDELFTRGDGQGNPTLPLVGGAAAFKLILYPGGPIAVSGLTLDVEAFDGKAWQPHSRNVLSP